MYSYVTEYSTKYNKYIHFNYNNKYNKYTYFNYSTEYNIIQQVYCFIAQYREQ